MGAGRTNAQGPTGASVEQATPTIVVNSSTGLITASATQQAGLVAAGTKTATQQLSVQGATTVTPTTSEQTIVDAGKFTTGVIKVAAMPSGTAGTPTATKGAVSNHSVTITPTVTNTTGYITGGTKNGTAITVTASELASGTKTITTNGTGFDVVGYSTVDVAVPQTNVETGKTYTVSASGTTSINPSSGYTAMDSVALTVPSGSATTPATSVTATPSISVNPSTGVITATASATKSVTPNVSAGWTTSGTAGTITVTGSNTLQLSTQAATTISPTESEQTAVDAGKYTTGVIKVGAIPSNYVGSGVPQRTSSDLTASGATVTVPAGFYGSSASKSVASGTEGTPVATKGAVENHAITITPSVTNTEGYIVGGTKTGTAVTVYAQDLVSGTKYIYHNDWPNVSVYRQVAVEVSKDEIPKQNVTTVLHQSGLYYQGEIEKVSWMIDEDAWYEVSFDGITYLVQAKEGSGGYGIYILGDENEGEPDFSNYPFYIRFSENLGNIFAGLFTEAAGTYSVRVAQHIDDVIVPQQSATTIDYGGGICGGALSNVEPPIVLSETYTVTFDGNTYTLTAEAGEFDYQNTSYLGELDGNNEPVYTTYPFFITIGDWGGDLYTETVGTYTVEVVKGSTGGGGGEAIAIVDTPDAAGGTIRTITAVDLSHDTIVADKLFQGYTAHDATGAPVVGSYVPPAGVDLPTFTATVDGGGNISITCDKTYAECEALANDNSNAAILDAGAKVGMALTEWGHDYITYAQTTITPGLSIGTISITIHSDDTITFTDDNINSRDSTSLLVSGATVTAEAGWYETNVSKSVASGTAGTPTATKGTVSNHSITVTPSVTNTTGYITGSTKTGTAVTVTAAELASGSKNITSNGSNIDVVGYSTVNVSVSPNVTTLNVTPTTSQQTFNASTAGYDGYSTVVVSAVPSGTAGTPTATKSAVSNHSVTVTPSVTNTTGYITGSTKTGTAVTVTAAELVSGSETKTQNGTYDVTNLASLVVDVTSSSGKSGQLQSKSARTSSTTYTDMGFEITVAKSGTYNIYWTGYRSSTGGTNGAQIYVNGVASGNAVTTFDGTYANCQNGVRSNVSLTAGDKVTIRARARSTSYYMYIMNLAIIEV